MSQLTTSIATPSAITTQVVLDGNPLLNVTVQQSLPATVTLVSMGQRGDPGAAGSGGDKSYTHPQPVPAAEWTVTHNLGKFPSVTVVDSTGDVVEGDIRHLDANTLVLSFSAGFSGSAYLN